METAPLAFRETLDRNLTFRTTMGAEARLEPLQPETVPLYTETGILAYRSQYAQIWQNGDPRHYLQWHFNPQKVLRDLENPALRHVLLYSDGMVAGIVKLDLGKDSGDFYPGQALFIEKIYLKKAFTGQGLGSALLGNLCQYARLSGLHALWLEAMYKGPARAFYLQHGFRFLATTEVPYPEILPGQRVMWVMGREV